MQSHPVSSIPFFGSIIFERASYYGLRACVVLFFISNTINLSHVEAFAFYGMGATTLGVAYLLGGLLGLIDEPKIVALAGMGVQLLGTLVLAFSVNSDLAFVGFLLIGVGVGVSKPNLFGFLGKIYKRRAVLDSALTIHYVMVNLGAFLGVLLTAQYAQEDGFRYAFLICAVLLLVSMTLLFFANNETTEKVVESKPENEYENIFLSIIIIVGTIAAIFYWYFYEGAVPKITMLTYDIPGLESFNYEFVSSVNMAVVIGLGVVLAMVYSVMRVDVTIKLGIGFILTALASLLLAYFDTDKENAGSVITGYFVLMSVAEIFFAPVIYGYILHKMDTKIATLIIGASLFIFMLAMKNQMFDEHVTLNRVADIATKTMFFFGLVFIGLFFVQRYTMKESDEDTLI